MRAVISAWACLLATGCATADRATFTLYRSSALDPEMRIHVATFDAEEGHSSAAYNGENCQIAAGLFAKQEGVTIRYWCEPGRFVK